MRLQTLAWLDVAGILASSLALTAATGAVLPFALADIAIGIVTLWIGYTIDWIWLRWPVAVIADLAVVALAAGVASQTATDPPSRIVAVQLFLLIAYVSSVAIRTLVRGREVIPFEAAQSLAALVVGFGGAAYVARATGVGGTVLVTIALAWGAICYAVAFAFVARRQGIRRNFYFYTSMALALILAGSSFGLSEPYLWWTALAVTFAWIAGRAHRLTLTIHAATYVTAAAIASGLLTATFRALTGHAVSQSLVSPPLLLVFAAATLCWTMRPPQDDDARGRYAAIPRAAIAVIVAVAGAAWLAALGLSEATAPDVAAAIRTSALAITAVGLAWAGGRTRLSEAAWLVYPMLGIGAVKLVVEDFQRSSAATLFVALAAYGAALIIAPRVAMRK